MAAWETDPAPAALQREKQERRWSQETLALELGWDPAKVSHITRGKQRFSWDERVAVARVLGVPAETFGVSLRAPRASDSAGHDGYLSPASQMAELLRALGDSRAAIAGLSDEHNQLSATYAQVRSDVTGQALIAVKLGLAQAIGDVVPDSALAEQVIPLTQGALDTIAQLNNCPPQLLWRALHRHGNELRKAGKYNDAKRDLRKALAQAPSLKSQAITLLSLTRLAFQEGIRVNFDKGIETLRTLLEDKDLWTPGFHPIAVRDTELRGAIVFGIPQRQQSRELRQLVELGGTIPEPGLMSPHWHSIWAVGVGAEALSRRDVEVVRQATENGISHAETWGYERQVLRLKRVAASIDRPKLPAIANLRKAAIQVVAEQR